MKPLDFFIRQLEKTPIVEMALSRSKLGEKIEGIAKPLAQHWALVRYCVHYDFGNTNKEHWMNELAVCMESIQDWSTKGYDKTVLVREVLIKKMEVDKNLLRFIKRKFKQENIELTPDQLHTLEHDWIEQLPVLIKVLGSDQDIDDYIDEHLLKVNR